MQIVDTDAFLDMPLSTQALYFHFVMRADDEGFIDNPKRIMRLIGCQDDEFKVLITKRFILQFDSGVVVIKHWLIHNTIRMDRFNKTVYSDEKNMLTIKENMAYTENGNQMATNGLPNGNHLVPQVKLSKVKLSKVKLEKSRFAPPSLNELNNYIKENNYQIDGENFIDFYSSKGWMVGKNKMKDWKACVRTWARRDKKDNKRNIIKL